LSERKTKLQVIKKAVGRTISFVLLTIITLFISAVILVQLPKVQTFIVQKIAASITEKTGFDTQIESFRIKWFDTISLGNLVIKDTQDSTMISLHKLDIDFDIRSLFKGADLHIDDVRLEKLLIQLINNADDGDLNINEFIFRINKLTSSTKTHGTSEVKPFTIGRIRLINGEFLLSNPSLDTITDGLDYNHFKISEMYGDFSEFKIHYDTVSMQVRGLEGIEKVNNLRINNLRTNFLLTKNHLAFDKLNLSIGTSVIQDSLVFSYSEIGNMSYFNDSVSIHANLENSRIYSKDLGLFVPYLADIEQFYILDGEISGRVSQLSLNQFRIGFGKSSHISGNLFFEGLPDIDNTFLFAELANSSILINDLQPYLDRQQLQQLQPLARVNFQGDFIGLFQDFVATGNFRTGLGNIVSDINLKIIPNQIPEYSGSLQLIDFHVGRLIGEAETIGRVSMRGRIDGKGFTANDANFELNARFSKLGLLGYDYTGITTKAKFASNLFSGDLDILDPNLVLNATANIDFRNNADLVNIRAKLDTAFLRELKLTEDDIFISSTLYTDLRGLQIDSLTGFGEFVDTYLLYNGRSMKLDSLEFQSIKRGRDRSLKLSSSLLDVDMFGEFDFTTIVKDVQIFAKELELAIINDPLEIEKYYRGKDGKDRLRYRVDFNFDLKDVNPIIHLFDPYIFISPNTLVEGNFINGYTSIFALNSQIDFLRIGTNSFRNNLIDINASKIADSTDILASAYISSETFGKEEVSTLERMYVDFVWSEKKIDFSSRITQPATNSLAEIMGSIALLRNSTEITFKRSNLLALERQWFFDENNKITISGKEFEFSNIQLISGDQRISLIGFISEDPAKELRLETDNFQLENLNPFSPYPIYGTTDGFLSIQDFYNNQISNAKFMVDKFTLDRFLVGDINLTSTWIEDEELVDINLDVVRDGKKVIGISGFYFPKEEQNQLNLVANLDNANLNITEPFLAEIFSQIEGNVSGQIRIAGSLSSPTVLGQGALSNGSLRFNYLNTVYKFDGNIIFDQNEIGFRGLNLVDIFNNRAQISGGIFHDGFNDFLVEINGNMNNFMVLNTTLKDNSMYYGQAVATGRLNVLGPFSNLNISVQATTNRGTNIFIPISFSDNLEQSDFIHFVNFGDSLVLAQMETRAQTELSGIKLDFDITATPDAYMEIIFDQKAGDIIRGRGRGNIKLQIDTNGEFNMFGDYEITQGAYNFAMYGIISKEFIIEPGSRISWLGSPYEGILDIRASYRQLASLAPLARSESAQNDPAINRRYPTRVLMDLKGSMMAPDISFDIVIDDYPQNNIEVETLVSSFKFRIAADEQELNRQVFSLILLRTFTSENSFDTRGSSVGKSVSELFSSQLSHYISQVDPNLEVSLDLTGFDEQAMNSFQLRLSYTFLNGRLRITRDGTLTNLSNQVDVSSLAGDWMAEYLLSSDGAFRVKVYSRTNLNTANAALTTNPTTTGISLLYTQSFDKLNEFFASLRRRRSAAQTPVENGNGDQG
jgi:hypothetical protein